MSGTNLLRGPTLRNPDLVKLDHNIFLRVCVETALVTTASRAAAVRLAARRKSRLCESASLCLQVIPDEPLLPVMLLKIREEIRQQSRLFE
jgi:hypothetical protein